jgi:SAM-dependent methyltransferase
MIIPIIVCFFLPFSSVSALAYLNIAVNFLHRAERETVLVEYIPAEVKRILDLGTGDGRLVKLLNVGRPKIEESVAVNAFPIMLKSLREHFANDPNVKITEHDLNNPLSSLPSDLGYFDEIVSSFAIHHLSHERKHSLYEEIHTTYSILLAYLELNAICDFYVILDILHKWKINQTNYYQRRHN